MRETVIWMVYDPYGKIGYDCDMYLCKTREIALQVQEKLRRISNLEWSITERKVMKQNDIKEL